MFVYFEYHCCPAENFVMMKVFYVILFNTEALNLVWLRRRETAGENEELKPCSMCTCSAKYVEEHPQWAAQLT